MGRNEVRKALYDVVESLTNYELSHTAKKLLLHYFNGSRQDTTYKRAIEAIITYHPDGADVIRTGEGRVMKLLDILKHQADTWDKEP